MSGQTKTLPELIYNMMGEILHFVEMACCLKNNPQNFTPWSTKIRAIRLSTQNTNYVCEENLEVLMNFQLELSELWRIMQESFRTEQIYNYNNLQIQIKSMISRMQLKILLHRMEHL
jgi:hypothetical protein